MLEVVCDAPRFIGFNFAGTYVILCGRKDFGINQSQIK